MLERAVAGSALVDETALPVWDLLGYVLTSGAANLSGVLRPFDDLESLLVAGSGDDWFGRHG